MFLQYISFTLVLVAVAYAAVHLPPEIKTCKKTDPNFSECMTKSMTETLQLQFIKEGSKQFGIPKLEPLYVEKLELSADPSKSVRLNQKYEHMYMHGMTNSQITEFKLTDNGRDCIWEMEVRSPGTRMEADYELTGQVLVFPINGHGRCNVTLNGITNKHKATCEHYTKKGKSHLRIFDYTMHMSADQCYFDFPNIIPGNEQISREVGKAINENSLEIFKDVKGGFEKLLAGLHENIANSIFGKIPEEELFGS